MSFSRSILTGHSAPSVWRHWRCVNTKNIKTAKRECNEAAGLEGFNTLSPEDQTRVIQAWQDGSVSDVDAAYNDGHNGPAGNLEKLLQTDHASNDTNADPDSTRRKTILPSGPVTLIPNHRIALQSIPESATSSQSDRLSSYAESPTAMVGKKFKFTGTNGHETWEVSDILFNKQGWSSITIQHCRLMNDDRRKKIQQFKFDIFMSS
ncbi:hypothetical protein CVT25_013811 [Psilocybe cyanescens]|uniref:PARP-type domain-containing protein n=1 Tax=Psilocybe cyanescens TaxID=93625 RepID=A0A409X1Q4_PSICY|nr:hypothetical protein CVT25_013811 [Psilocybe cyanescens]